MNKTKFMLTGMICGIMTATIVFAQTIVPGGNVSGIWTAAGSPYLIEGEITVPEGDTLVINPGVEVIFQGNFKFRSNFVHHYS